MPGKLQAELRRKIPFQHLEEEAHLNIVRTADMLLQRFVDLLRPHELTATQYNVLRILRGAADAGLNCKEIGARLVTREPDITRLLDRLEKRHLITRTRSTGDRRHLNIQIAERGLRLLEQLDQPVLDLHSWVLEGMERERIHDLIRTLEDIRTRLSESAES